MHTPPPVPPGRTLTLVGLRCPFLPRSAASPRAPPEGARHHRTPPSSPGPRLGAPGPLAPAPTRQPSGRRTHQSADGAGPRRPAPGTFPGTETLPPRVSRARPRLGPASLTRGRFAWRPVHARLPLPSRRCCLGPRPPPVRSPSGPDRRSLRAGLPRAQRRVLLWGGRRGGRRGVVRRASRNYSLTGFLSFIKTQSCGDVTAWRPLRPRSGLPALGPAPRRPRPDRAPPTQGPISGPPRGGRSQPQSEAAGCVHVIPRESRVGGGVICLVFAVDSPVPLLLSPYTLCLDLIQSRGFKCHPYARDPQRASPSSRLPTLHLHPGAGGGPQKSNS